MRKEGRDICEFISWVQKGKKIYFLTGEQLNSKEGKHFVKVNGVSVDDFCGHCTIRKWFGLENYEGDEKECIDFSSPENFPAKIVEAIKAGKMRGLGTAEGLLLPAVNAKWQPERDAVYAKYQPEWDWDAVYAKYQPEWDAVNARYQAEWDAVNAKFWDLFADTKNRRKCWR